jgi:hypothetical protein
MLGILGRILAPRRCSAQPVDEQARDLRIEHSRLRAASKHNHHRGLSHIINGFEVKIHGPVAKDEERAEILRLLRGAQEEAAALLTRIADPQEILAEIEVMRARFLSQPATEQKPEAEKTA